MIPTVPDPARAKAESERALLAAGARVNDWLPVLDRVRPRQAREIADRALVLNAMIQLAFGAPKPLIRAWIDANRLISALSEKERALLEDEAPLTDAETSELQWSIEALWALMWALGQVSALFPTEPVQDTLAGMFPRVSENESAAAFYGLSRLRSFPESFQACDLYYRAHWYARDGSLNGYATGDFNLGVIEFRRKSLEWVCDSETDWNDIDLST